MNPRIKALAEQAGMEPEDGAVWWVGDGDLEKFAERIVLTCSNLLEHLGYDDAATYIKYDWKIKP